MAHGKKILIVEDDQYIREIYDMTLKEAGFEVDTAIDGQEGMFKAKDGGYKLILLDVMMPKVDGIGFLKGMKKDYPTAANGPIVLLTNMSQDPVITEALGLGAKDFLIKADLNPEEFLKKVTSYLG